MPYSKINNTVSGMDVLAKTIAVPRDHKAIRIPTFPALERTGVLSFTGTRTASVTANTDAYAMVCRDPAYPVWFTQVPNGGAPFSVYTVHLGFGTNLTATGGEYVTIPVATMANLKVSTGSTFIGASGSYSMPVLNYQGERYFYNCTSRCAVELSFTSPPGATIAILTITTINSSGNLANATLRANLIVTGNSAGASFALNDTTVGFKIDSFELFVTTTTVINNAAFGITTDSVSATNGLSIPVGIPRLTLFPVTLPVEAATTVIPWKAVRSTSVGALFSNVTAVMSKEGTVKAARVSTELVHPLHYASWGAAIDTVYPKDRYFGALENGLYTFTLPDSGSELYRDVILGGNDTLTNPSWAFDYCPCAVFDLDKLAYANLIIFSDIGSVDTALAVTIDRHIEFRSSSVLFPLGFSATQLEAYHAAQMALVQLGVFFENPTHLGMIATAVSQALRSVASYAYPVAKELGKAALTAAGDRILNMASKKMGQMNQVKMVKQPEVRKKKVKRSVRVVRRK